MVEGGIEHIEGSGDFLWDSLDWMRLMGLREQTQEILPVLRSNGIGLHGTTEKNLPSILKHGLDPKRTGRKKPEIFYYAYRPQHHGYDDKELTTRFLGSVRGAVIWAISHSDFEQAFWLWRGGEEEKGFLEAEMPVVVRFRPPSASSPGDDFPATITFPIESLSVAIRPEFSTHVTAPDLERLVGEVGEGFDDFQERLAGEFARKVVQGLATK